MLPERVRTERLTLRMWVEADLDPLAEVFAVEAVWRSPFERGLTREETAAFLERQRESWRTHGFGLWAAELCGTAELIGFIGLGVPLFLPEVLPAAEVGWCIPELTVERTIDAGDVVVVTGTEHGQHRENGGFRFAYSDLFTVREDLIAQVDSYVSRSHDQLRTPPST